jgi:prepilin peptidase CpaA
MLQSVPLPMLVVGLTVFAAALTDLWKYKVHNFLTLPLLATGLLYHLLVNGLAGLADSAFGAALGFSMFFLLYLFGGMGAGDVKLVAALGAWLGPWMTLFACLFTAIAGGVYALVVILWRGRLRETWLNFQVIWYRVAAASKHFSSEDGIEHAVRQPNRRERVIPYASMIAIGVLTFFVIICREGVLHLWLP